MGNCKDSAAANRHGNYDNLPPAGQKEWVTFPVETLLSVPAVLLQYFVPNLNRIVGNQNRWVL